MGENMEMETEAPLLLTSYGKGLSRHLIYYLPDDRCRVLNIPVFHNKKVIGVSYGWLVLMAPTNGECCLFNPISMDTIQLPRLTLNALWYYQCILTKPPNDPDSQVLFNSSVDQSYCRIGDEDFFAMGPQFEEDSPFLYTMVSFQGQIYGFMDPGHQFVSIHLKTGEKLEFTPIQLMAEDGSGPWVLPRSTLSMSSHKIWLIESLHGDEVELLMIQRTSLTSLGDAALGFRVFRIDIDQKRCVELMNIGKRTIFVSNCGRGYCYIAKGVTPNSIYYTLDPPHNDMHLHIFDLEDRSTTLQPLSRLVGYDSESSWIDANLFSRHRDKTNLSLRCNPSGQNKCIL